MRPVRVALVAQFFPPITITAGSSNSVTVVRLPVAGADVTVITGMPNFPSGQLHPNDRRAWFRRERAGRITVERVWTYASTAISGKTRLLNWASVAIGATLRLLALRRVDVVIVSSPPITLALPAIIGAIRHRATLIADIRDVFPEIAITMGAWRRTSPIVRGVGAVADALYRRARMVVCVTESARDEIAARGVPPAKLFVAPNGFDRIEPQAGDAPIVRTPGDFLIVYVGNMGLATGLDVVLGAAKELRDDVRFRFVLVGGGADARRLMERAQAEALTNVVFAGVRPRAEALAILAEADACVVPLKGTIRDSLPTKMFDAMALGIPIVLSAAGEAETLLSRADAGIAAAPEDPHALVAAIRELARDPAAARRHGQSGRSYVTDHYDRERIMLALAQRILGEPGSPAHARMAVAGTIASGRA